MSRGLPIRTAWLLDGRRFGADILDANPPLAWFLMLPAALAARWKLVSEIVAIQAWTWLLTIAGLALSAAALVPMTRLLGRIQVIGLLVIGVAVSAILPIGNFGQRDVLAFILILPYLFSMMGRASGLPSTGRALPMLIGLAAGFGICLKPFLIVVPLLIELLHLALARNFRDLIRTETLAMAATMLLYAGAILLFARDYLEFALPLVRAVYWAYDDTGYLIGEHFKVASMPAAYALGITLVPCRSTACMPWLLPRSPVSRSATGCRARAFRITRSRCWERAACTWSLPSCRGSMPSVRALALRAASCAG